ncbi:inverse autotransporter beta domain-containing protein [Escherichia coli]
MSKKYQPLLITHYMSTWVTITEAVEITTKAIKQKITPSDIYRHALSGNILLSVYFQSPVILKKIQTFNGKIKFRQFVGNLLDKLCMLDRDGFIYGQNLRLCTEARYICPVQQIIDTPLLRKLNQSFHLRLCTEARYICPVQQIIDTPLLRKLNQFRTFVRNVRPGDELDVQAQVSEKNLTPPPGNSSGNLEQQIASTSQLIGSLLAEDMNSEQAANIARGWASSQASGVMTDWLSRFGTARITLGVDEDFSLKNSRDGNPRKWRFDATNSELCAERHEC